MRKTDTPTKPQDTGILSGLLAAFIISSAGSSSPAFAAGIAYLDFGTDPGLSSARLESGVDFVNDDDFAEDESDNQQGATISRILLGNTTQSIIVPLKITSPGTGFTLERGDRALKYAIDRPDIQVIDYNHLQPASLGVQRDAISSGKVIVMQAGDGGLDSPTNQARTVPVLNGGAIIVGGIDGNQRISGQSNQAGDLKDHYMVAPIDSSVSSARSTAFARARVSATAAKVFEAAPFLTPQQVVEILFRSATDLGASGVDAVYGHGALDVEAALDPAGITSVTTDGGSNSGGGSGSSSTAGLIIAGALGYALLKRSRTLQKTLILDQYGRGYGTDLISAAPKLGDGDISSLLNFTPLNTTQNGLSQQTWGIKDHSSFSAQSSVVQLNALGQHFSPDPIALDASGNQADVRFSYASESHSTSGWGSSQLYNIPLSLTLGVNAENTALHALHLGSSFSSPFIGFANNSGAYTFSHAGAGKSHQFGFALHDDQGRHGAASRSMLYEGIIEKGKAKMGLQVAYTREDKSLYGSAARGALGVDGADTLSLTVSGAYQLSTKLDLIGSYSLGRTKVNAARNSLLTGFSTLDSQSGAIGLVAHDALSSGDSIALVYSTPLHLSGGQIDLRTPTSQLADGSVLFSDETISFDGLSTPVKRLNLHYSRPINSRLTWSNRVVYQTGSYDQGADSYGVLTRLDFEF